MTELIRFTWADIDQLAVETAKRWEAAVVEGLVTAAYGVPRGGHIPALLVARQLGLPLVDDLAAYVSVASAARVLVIDDLVDSGRTLARFEYVGHPVDALARKPRSPAGPAAGAATFDGWLVFPWEATDEGSGPEDAVVRLLEFIGEDPTRDGLRDTPARVLRSLAQMTGGYDQSAEAILATQFDVAHDELVMLRGIPFASLCEHHLLPFVGTATVGYIPDPEKGKVVGLSKLARVVHVFARRCQVQERLGHQIADALETALEPIGVGVIIEAHHACMSCRGVQSQGDMVTSVMHGVLRDKPEARAEFMSIHNAGRS